MMKEARQACSNSGGFRVGSGKNFECKFGQDAIDHIENLGENSPAYDRGQEWLENNPVDPNESTVDDDTTEQTAEDEYIEQIAEIEESIGTTLEDSLTHYQNASDGNANTLYNILVQDGNWSPLEAEKLITSVRGDPTNQDAVTLENAINNAGYYVPGGILKTPGEANQVTYEDTDGDGIVDSAIRDSVFDTLDETVIRGDSIRPGLEAAIEQSIKDQERREEEAAAEEAAAEEAAAEEAAAEEESPLVIGDVVEKVKEAFPTWEDLWGKIKDELPSNPQEWGGFIRGVIEAAGVDLPSGDVWEILNGGYGVTTTPSIGTGGIAGILDPANQMVFVPGIPVGLPPSSMILTSVEDLLKDPIGAIAGRVEEVFEGIVTDPSGFAKDILSQAADVPPELWAVLAGGVEASKDVIDWVTDAVSGGDEDTEETTITGTDTEETTVPETTTETTTTPPVAAAALAQAPQEKVTGLLTQMQNQFQQTPEQTVTADDFANLNLNNSNDFTFGHQGGTGDSITNNYSEDDTSEKDLSNSFTFGGDSVVTNDQTIEFSGGLPPETIDELEEKYSNDVISGGGGGGGAGGAGGTANAQDYWKGIPYKLPQIQSVQAGPAQKPLSMENLFAQWLKGL
jgi:hypothetical protein